MEDDGLRIGSVDRGDAGVEVGVGKRARDEPLQTEFHVCGREIAAVDRRLVVELYPRSEMKDERLVIGLLPLTGQSALCRLVGELDRLAELQAKKAVVDEGEDRLSRGGVRPGSSNLPVFGRG